MMSFQGPTEKRGTVVMKQGSGFIYKILSVDLLIVAELLFSILMLPKLFTA